LLATLALLLLAACSDGHHRHDRRDAQVPVDDAGTPPGQPDASLDASSEPDAAQLDAGMDAMPIADAASDAHEPPPPPPHPTSKRCGDALRDPQLEECDDGPDDSAGLDVCSDDCRVRSAPISVLGETDGGAPETAHGSFGSCPHTLAATDERLAIAFVDETGSPTLQLFSSLGTRRGDARALASDAAPLLTPNPCAATLPDGRFVLSWSDTSSGTPDILMRTFDPERGKLGAVRLVHESTAGSQTEADVLWVGKHLIVAYTDLLDVKYRAFDAKLRPVHGDRLLETGMDLQSSVSLAAIGGSEWAAAFRSTDGVFEAIHVVSGNDTWSTELAAPSPIGDRPVLAALDAKHLLLAFTVGTDPFATGTASVARIRVAVLDLDAPGHVTTQELLPSSEPYKSNAAVLEQRHPRLIAADGAAYLAWENDAPPGTAPSTVILLARFELGTNAELIQQPEIPIDVGSDSLSDAEPQLAATNLFPGGALLSAWQHDPNKDQELRMSLRPVPWVELP
jgi:hypothetical protein